MAKKVNPLAVLATALVGLTVVSGCGAGAQPVKRPFVARNGAESGPSSGLWGDGSSEPGGLHTGCIRGRRFAVLITVHNRSKPPAAASPFYGKSGRLGRRPGPRSIFEASGTSRSPHRR